MNPNQIAVKFFGALLSSYALFSGLEKFSQSIAGNTGSLIGASLGTSGTFNTYPIGFLSTEMIFLAVGLTLLFANFFDSK